MDVVFLDANVLFSAAAVGAGATHLLTGDITHFGHLFGKEIGNVTILTPSQYLRRPLGEERGPL